MSISAQSCRLIFASLFAVSSVSLLAQTDNTTQNNTVVIQNQSHKVYSGLNVTTSSGDCIQVIDSTDITIENSQIGPCGGNGINISGGSGIYIYDSYIHPETLSSGCCDNNDGVLAQYTSNVFVQGNVIAYSESNVEAPQGVTGLTVTGNFLLNPRGPLPRGQNLQAWNVTNVLAQNNYTLSSQDTKKYLYPDHQEDSINFGYATGATAQGNYLTGGHSPSGCALEADEAANSVSFIKNEMVDTGQCGIGVASGTNQTIQANKVINRTPVVGGGNTAISVWKQYPLPCGPVAVTDNIATELRSDGTQSGWWDGGGCEPVTLTGNVWNQAARAQLTPVAQKLPPPLVPPQPKHCVARSPYSTQTSFPQCP